MASTVNPPIQSPKRLNIVKQHKTSCCVWPKPPKIHPGFPASSSLSRILAFNFMMASWQFGSSIWTSPWTHWAGPCKLLRRQSRFVCRKCTCKQLGAFRTLNRKTIMKPILWCPLFAVQFRAASSQQTRQRHVSQHLRKQHVNPLCLDHYLKECAKAYGHISLRNQHSAVPTRGHSSGRQKQSMLLDVKLVDS